MKNWQEIAPLLEERDEHLDNAEAAGTDEEFWQHTLRYWQTSAQIWHLFGQPEKEALALTEVELARAQLAAHGRAIRI